MSGYDEFEFGHPIATEEATVDFNPIEVQKHLKGASYPASKEDLASLAESNGAPNELVDQLRNAERDEFSGPDDVQESLKRS